MDAAIWVVPLEGDPNEFIPLSQFPKVVRHLVVLFHYIQQMLGMLFSNILYPKVINYKSEADWAPFMCPQAGGILTLVIPRRIEPFF